MLGCRSAAGAVARLGALALLGFLLGTVPSAAELNYWSREAQVPLTGVVPPPRVGSMGTYLPQSRQWLEFGGEDSTGLQLKDTWLYTFSTDTWEKIFDGATEIARNPQTYPSGRSWGTMVLVNSAAYMYGGSCSQDPEPARGTPCQDVLWEFNLLSRQWSNLVVGDEGTYPGSRTGHAAGLWDNTMIVYGGSKGGTRSGDATTDMTDTLWIFDPLQYRGTAKTNGWTAVRLANSTNGGASPAGRMLGPDGSVLAQQSITPMYGHALLVNTDLVIVQGGYRLISAKDLGKNTAVDNTSEYRVDNGLLYIDLTQFGTRRTNLSQAPSQANVLWVLEIPVAPPFRAFHKMFMYTDTADVSRYLVVDGWGNTLQRSTATADHYNAVPTAIEALVEAVIGSAAKSATNPIPARPAVIWTTHSVLGTITPGPLVSYSGVFIPLIGPTLFGGSKCTNTANGAAGSPTRCTATNTDVWMLDLYGTRVTQGRLQVSNYDEKGSPTAPDTVYVLVTGNAQDSRAGAANMIFDAVPSGQVVIADFLNGIPAGATAINNVGVDPQVTIQAKVTYVAEVTATLRMVAEDNITSLAGYQVAVENQVTLPAISTLSNYTFVPYKRYASTLPVTDAAGEVQLTLRPTELANLPQIWYTQYRVKVLDKQDPSKYVYVNDNLHLDTAGRWVTYNYTYDAAGQLTLNNKIVVQSAAAAGAAAQSQGGSAVPLTLGISSPSYLFSNGTLGKDVRGSVVNRQVVSRSMASTPGRIDFAPGMRSASVYSDKGTTRPSAYVYYEIDLGYVQGTQDVSVTIALAGVSTNSLAAYVNLASSAATNQTFTNATSCPAHSCFATTNITGGQICIQSAKNATMCMPVTCAGGSCTFTISTDIKKQFLPCRPIDPKYGSNVDSQGNCITDYAGPLSLSVGFVWTPTSARRRALQQAATPAATATPTPAATTAATPTPTSTPKATAAATPTSAPTTPPTPTASPTPTSSPTPSPTVSYSFAVQLVAASQPPSTPSPTQGAATTSRQLVNSNARRILAATFSSLGAVVVAAAAWRFWVTRRKEKPVEVVDLRTAAKGKHKDGLIVAADEEAMLGPSVSFINQITKAMAGRATQQEENADRLRNALQDIQSDKPKLSQEEMGSKLTALQEKYRLL